MNLKPKYDVLKKAEKCNSWKIKYPVLKFGVDKKYVNPYFIENLSEVLNKKDIIIADDGAHLTWAGFKLKIKGTKIFFSGNSPMVMHYQLL